MNEPVVLSPGPRAATQEIDVWWGGYSSRAMLPKLLLSATVTAIIIGAAWTVMDRAYVQGSVWALVGVLWLLQTLQFTRRVLGRSYRMTTRRILVLHAHLFPWRGELPLKNIAHVAVKQTRLGRLLGVGHVIVVGKSGEKLVLKGVRRPEETANRILAMEKVVDNEQSGD